VTPNGRVHVVITSLLDSVAYPAEGFADLYHSRWRIEEAFKRLKHRMALENTPYILRIFNHRHFLEDWNALR